MNRHIQVLLTVLVAIALCAAPARGGVREGRGWNKRNWQSFGPKAN